MRLSQVRQAFAEKIAALDGFKESKHTPDFFGRTENTVAHLAFTVSMASSSAMDERQRSAVGQYISTPVQVVFSYRLRPLDIYPTDYDLAMDTEEAIIAACLDAYTSPKNLFTVRYVGSTREVTESQEYMIIYIDFTTLHTINLES